MSPRTEAALDRAAKWSGAILGAVALLVMLLAAAGFERASDHDADVQSLTHRHEDDIYRLERKLDCALWELPKGCRETMSPREAR